MVDFVFSTRFLVGFASAIALGLLLHNVRSFPYRVTPSNGS